jgi:hypothetical protein
LKIAVCPDAGGKDVFLKLTSTQNLKKPSGAAKVAFGMLYCNKIHIVSIRISSTLRLRGTPDYKWGNPNKSGKMQVVKALLEMWKRFGHKTLLFSPGVQMPASIPYSYGVSIYR